MTPRHALRGRILALAVLALGLLASSGAMAQDLMTKFSAGGGAVGQQAESQIFVQNMGPGVFGLGGQNAPTVQFSLQLPTAFTGVAFTAPGWACNILSTSAGPKVACIRKGVLAKLQEYDAIYVRYASPNIGQHQLCAKVTVAPGMAGGFDPNPGNNNPCQMVSFVAPPPLCLMGGTGPRVRGGTPLMVTGTGTDVQPLAADAKAQGDWTYQVQMTSNFIYSDWTKAKLKSGSCAPSGPPASPTFTCTRSAQPCR